MRDRTRAAATRPARGTPGTDGTCRLRALARRARRGRPSPAKAILSKSVWREPRATAAVELRAARVPRGAQLQLDERGQRGAQRLLEHQVRSSRSSSWWWSSTRESRAQIRHRPDDRVQLPGATTRPVRRSARIVGRAAASDSPRPGTRRVPSLRARRRPRRPCSAERPRRARSTAHFDRSDALRPPGEVERGRVAIRLTRFASIGRRSWNRVSVSPSTGGGSSSWTRPRGAPRRTEHDGQSTGRCDRRLGRSCGCWGADSCKFFKLPNLPYEAAVASTLEEHHASSSSSTQCIGLGRRRGHPPIVAAGHPRPRPRRSRLRPRRS